MSLVNPTITRGGLALTGFTVSADHHVAVVIPAYKVARHIAEVIARIPEEVWRIYVVDDHCPQGSGDHVEANCVDPRIVVLRHTENQGVGGAVMTGYEAALKDGADVIVKIDGDGQMDPVLINRFIAPILSGKADYTKGNRFFDLDTIHAMPKLRLIGNALLSFINKVSSGYWDIFDPANGYTAIHANVARRLALHKISKRYFFESDMLFRLSLLRAVVFDVPMDARYGTETSNLSVRKVAPEFLWKHVRNFFKRILYNYYLHDMTVASFQLPIGIALLVGGAIYGGYQWLAFAAVGAPAPTGTVVLPAMCILVGTQLLLAFIDNDVNSVPRRPIQTQDPPSEIAATSPTQGESH